MEPPRPKYYEAKPIGTESVSLPQRILKLVRMKQTDSEEFRSLIAIFGREKVKEMYESELKKERKK